MVGLYIHIPFCKSKCGYCDFVSYTDRDSLKGKYIDAVTAEAAQYDGETADTVFIGGGTPSTLDDGEISRLLDGVRNHISIADGAELTIEANPNSITAEKAAEYKNAGINRVSIGMQAAQEHLLREIGRTHTKDDFLRAVETVKDAGIDNISADMIYSLPGQTTAEAVETAELLASLPLRHVSAYALKLERGVPMYGAEQPDEDADREMFHAVKDVLNSNGIMRYEISNFARPGFECRHNLKYWRVEDYIGLGAAAHSCYKKERFANTEILEKYIRKSGKKGGARTSALPVYDELFEKIMLNTRLLEGMDASLLPKEADNSLSMMEKNGILMQKGGRIILTDKGLDLQNAVVIELTRFTSV